jgi:hypothetical protein
MEVSTIFIVIAALAIVDDFLLFLMAKRVGGKLGLGLRLVGISLFVFVIYMFIDFLVLALGLLPMGPYLLIHEIVETFLFGSLFVGVWMIFKALRGG